MYFQHTLYVFPIYMVDYELIYKEQNDLLEKDKDVYFQKKKHYKSDQQKLIACYHKTSYIRAD